MRYQHVTRIVKADPPIGTPALLQSRFDAELSNMEGNGFEFVQAVLLQSAPQTYLLVFKKQVGTPAGQMK